MWMVMREEEKGIDLVRGCNRRLRFRISQGLNDIPSDARTTREVCNARCRARRRNAILDRSGRENIPRSSRSKLGTYCGEVALYRCWVKQMEGFKHLRFEGDSGVQRLITVLSVFSRAFQHWMVNFFTSDTLQSTVPLKTITAKYR